MPFRRARSETGKGLASMAVYDRQVRTVDNAADVGGPYQRSSPHFSPITDEGRFRVKEWVAGESWTLGWTMRRNSWVSTAMRTTISGSKRRDLTCGDRPRPEPKEEVVFPAIDQAYRQQRRGSACRFRRMSAKISA